MKVTKTALAVVCAALLAVQMFALLVPGSVSIAGPRPGNGESSCIPCQGGGCCGWECVCSPLGECGPPCSYGTPS